MGVKTELCSRHDTRVGTFKQCGNCPGPGTCLPRAIAPLPPLDLPVEFGDADEAAAREAYEAALQAEGQQILKEACAFIDRFTVLPHEAATWGVVLWAAHCWIYRAFTETARFHITSTEYGSGKTHLAEMICLLSPRPEMAAHYTGPSIYHVIPERDPAPLVFDEADAQFSAGGQRGETKRGILNAGYKYNGKITRVVGGTAVDFPVYCPVIFAGTGKLPKSLEDRSISVCMSKRKSGQQMDRFIEKMHAGLGRDIGLKLGGWATAIQGPAGDILWDEPPAELSDRQVDILTPMYAIAQMAGGEWPERFDAIVDVLVIGGASKKEASPDAALLAAALEVWPENKPRIVAHELADLLAGHTSGKYSWPEGQRAPELNARMRDVGLPPVPMRIGPKVMRGYDRTAVEDKLAEVSVTAPTSSTASDLLLPVTDVTSRRAGRLDLGLLRGEPSGRQ